MAAPPCSPPLSRALVVERHGALRESLSRSLAARLTAVESCCPEDPVARILAEFRPEVVFVDARSLDEGWVRAGADEAEAPVWVVLTDAAPPGAPRDRVFVRKPLTGERVDEAIARARALRRPAG